MDTDNWDNSVGLNNPGQSGDIDSPHYRDLYELWSRGKYFPIFYSREGGQRGGEASHAFARQLIVIPGEARSARKGDPGIAMSFEYLDRPGSPSPRNGVSRPGSAGNDKLLVRGRRWTA
ncbi:MAG: penicillin acylase family protein [Pseudomonadota bacterium]